MSIAELRQEIASRRQQIDPATNGPLSTHNKEMEIHKRFSIPVACLVFGLIGLALGATHRRDGALGSFVIGIAVGLCLLRAADDRPVARQGSLPGTVARIMVAQSGPRRARHSDVRLARSAGRSALPVLRPAVAHAARGRRHFRIPGLTILDDYVTRAYTSYALLSAIALLGIIYIAAFVDMSDKLFKGMVTGMTMLDYFRYSTPAVALLRHSAGGVC